MNETPSVPAPPSVHAPGDELYLLDYVLAVWRRWRLVAAIFVLAVAAAVTYSLVAPKVYDATAGLLSPKDDSNTGALAGLLMSGASTLGLSLPSSTSNRDMLVAVFKSRAAAEVVVRRFGLVKRYDVDYEQDAVKKFREDVAKVDVSKEGVITLVVSDPDPKLAAAMLSVWIEHVDRVVSKYGTSEAGRERAFIQAQLAKTRVDLEREENALRKFQERHRAILLPEQTRGAIDAAARVKAEVIASEVQLQVLRTFATEANPDVVALKRRIDEMKRQLESVQYADALPRNGRPDFHVPFDRVPEVGLELARLIREVKVQETVLALLTQQFEQSRIAEAKDLPIVQVLDPPKPPERHARPQLPLNTAIGAALGLVAGVLVALFLDYVGRVRAMTSREPA